MFEAWGRKVYAWRWQTLAISGLMLVISAFIVWRGGTLQTGAIEVTEAVRSLRLIESELRSEHTSGFTIIFHSDTLTTADEAFGQDVQRAVAELRRDPHVVRVRTPWDEETGMFLSQSMQSIEGHDALVSVVLNEEAIRSTRFFPEIRAKIRPRVLQAHVTGFASFRSDLDQILESDLQRAEIISAPLALIVLMLVFGSFVSALVPVGVGGLSVIGGLAGVYLLARVMPIAQYAVNIVSLVGLGVAIDYSLFLVSRYREELEHGLSVEDALARSVATAGRAIAFSGLAVGIGMAGLLFFERSYFVSVGVGGMLVITLLVIYSMTFLPALLGVLGHNINRGRIALPLKTHGGFWHRIAHAVMRHPFVVLVPTLLVLGFAARPFVDLRMSVPDETALPLTSETRVGAAKLEAAFPERALTNIAVVVQFPGAPLANAARVGALWDLGQRLSQIDGVDHVESVMNLDGFLDREGHVALFTGPAENIDEGHRLMVRESVGRTTVLFSVLTDADPASDKARAIVRAIRSRAHVADGALLVSGQTAIDLDSTAYLKQHIPKAITFIVVLTMLVLFVLLGSVVLPFKAVMMNVLSLTASFGALVWIFQEGHLANVLHFTPGPIEPSVPILLFCLTFGLSMDYEVLLLTRMQEEYRRSHDNAHAVAEGLERSGRLITSGAAIMVSVFAAYGFAQLTLLKVLGLGMALAIVLDATIVRILIVPATMRLFGDLNWWAPKMFAFLQKNRGEH